MTSLIPISRQELQAGPNQLQKKKQIQQILQGIYKYVNIAAMNGEKEYFYPFPMKMGVNIQGNGLGYTSNDIYITREDIIYELITLFPNVTITALPEKRTQQTVYQQGGLLLDWS